MCKIRILDTNNTNIYTYIHAHIRKYRKDTHICIKYIRKIKYLRSQVVWTDEISYSSHNLFIRFSHTILACNSFSLQYAYLHDEDLLPVLGLDDLVFPGPQGSFLKVRLVFVVREQMHGRPFLSQKIHIVVRVVSHTDVDGLKPSAIRPEVATREAISEVQIR